MRVVTTHLTADFDAFAAAVVMARLEPGFHVLFPGSLEAGVRRFVGAVELEVPEVRLRDARRARLEEAIVVDTSSPERLGEVWELIRRDRCPVRLLLDHHPDEGDGIAAGRSVVRPVGATCTVVVELLRETGRVPTPEEASLLLLGIYEDTGGLTSTGTTPDDLAAAAWLLEHGGSLDWVRRFVSKVLEPHQFELLSRLVEGSDEVTVGGTRVAVAVVETERYHEEAAYVVHRWVETFEIPVGVALFVRPPHVNVILRSRLPGLDVGRVARRLGGGGHATAASARMSDAVPVEVRQRVLDLLAEAMPPAVRARDLAGPRIFTVDVDATVAEAKERIDRLRVNALPVRDPATGRLVGTVTRQILDRALGHGLGDRPVRTAMQPGVPTVPADAPVEVVRDRFLEGSHRFVVVTEEERPVGLITRMELFRELFGRQREAGSTLDNRMAGARPVTQPVTRRLREVPPPWVRELLPAVRETADRLGVPVYLVGGVVRDLLLGRPNEDVDLVVEGDGIAFAGALAARLGGRVHPHPPFLTAVVTLRDGHRVDVASARTEFYRTPAALPEVETSLIRQDLYRRDFTINALAVALSGPRYGQLLDFFGGRRDLERGEIRVLHSLSFIDDPTRAIRAVRYARRLGFRIAADTRRLIATALEEGVFRRLSGQRLRRELELLLEEPNPAGAVAALGELGLLGELDPALERVEGLEAFLLDVERMAEWYRLEELGSPPPQERLFLLALVAAAGAEAAPRLVERLGLAGRRAEAARRLPARVEALAARAHEGVPASALVEDVERAGIEAALLALARLDADARPRLARAVAASARVGVPVRGAELIASGLPPGPHIGAGVRAARAALVDGVIAPEEALEVALEAARRALAVREPQP